MNETAKTETVRPSDLVEDQLPDVDSRLECGRH